MILDDLREYGHGGATKDRHIRNKLQADMVYYIVLKEMLHDYGIEGSRDINTIHPDGLGAARDQMAMRASDQGLIEYVTEGENENLISRFTVPNADGTGTVSGDSLTGDVVPGFVRQAILNSEALQNMVMKHLVSNSDGSVKLNDETKAAMTEAEFQRILDPQDPDSVLSRVVRSVRSFDLTAGVTADGQSFADTDHDLYAYHAPDEQLQTSDGGFVRDIGMRPGRAHDCLKISPLMPEFRSLRRSGTPAAGRLGLYSMVKQFSGSRNMNAVLQFDTQKSLLQVASSRFHGEYLTRSVGDMFGAQGDMFIVHDRNDENFVRGASYERVQTVTTEMYDNSGENGQYESTGEVLRTEQQRVRVYAYDPQKVGSDMKLQFGWRMAELMDKYSQRELEPEDLSVAFSMFDRQIGGVQFGQTVFGDPQINGAEAVNANARYYFDYIEHVFSTVRDKMSSHEFEIHFAPQTYVERETGGFLPLLYVTGEHTHDINRAKSNPTRFFSFYPYLDYIPKNLAVQPVAGDIVSGSYDPYSITNRTFRASADAETNGTNSVTSNEYVQMHNITREMVDGMRKTFDAWDHPVQMAGRDVSVVKMARSVGNTGAADLSEFINTPSGTVNTEKVIKALQDDMEASKAVARAGFLRPENRERMVSIIQTFIAEECEGCTKPDDSDFTFGDAVYMLANRMRRGSTASDVERELSKRLEALAARELNTSYGADVTGYTAARHVYHAYLGKLVLDVTSSLANDVSLLNQRDNTLSSEVLEAAPTLDREYSERVIREMLDDISDPDSPTLNGALDQVYGYTENGNVLIKANMCRHASSGIMPDDYDNLLRLLSYTNEVAYVGDPTVSNQIGLAAARSITVQIYAPEAFNVRSFVRWPATNSRTSNSNERSEMRQAFRDENGAYLSEAATEEGQDPVSVNETLEPDEDASNFQSTRDERAWFDATFAVQNPGVDLTFEWMTRDRRGPDGLYDPNDYDTYRCAVWKATHPLQFAAMTRVHNFLRQTDGNGYDPSNLFMTETGMLYYQNQSGDTVLKLGPFTERQAWIRPVVEDTTADDLTAQEIEVPSRDATGVFLRDATGTVITEQKYVHVTSEVVIDPVTGEMRNEVAFGPLDTESSIHGVRKEEAVVMNRYYGLSGKVQNYDGYNHSGLNMSDRVKIFSYQMSVLDNLDRCLGIYHATHHGTASKPELMQAVFFANVSANSLSKCYRTNTYILEDKAKCQAANQYLSNFVTNQTQPGSGQYINIFIDHSHEGEAAARRVANLMFTQSKMFENRVVLSRVDIDENVGLYGMLLNLDQMNGANITGEFSRKNIRRSDCKGSRVGLQTENPKFDSILTGSARNIGAVAFLTDSVEFDPITGKLTVLNGAGPESSAVLVSMGVLDFVNGGIDAKFMPHKGGQAVDRAQLSTNGAEKSLMYSPATFAMINLGYNMEDGYIVAKRAVNKFGHFNEDGQFQPLQKWDKIGDTESGNKGIVSKIVNTDIEDEDEFRTEFVYDYLKTYMFNHGSAHDDALKSPLDKQLNLYMQMFAGTGSYDGSDWKSALLAVECSDGRTVGEKLEELRCVELGTKNRNGFVTGDPEALKAEIHDALCAEGGLLDGLGSYLDSSGVEPFAGAYRVERDIWRLFRDNPDLDLAMTNVCVCTRSNPSILMSVQDQTEAGNGDLIIRDADGNGVTVPGAKGVFTVYTDSHTSDDKNKDYNEVTFKQGRALAAQEMYAIQAKHAGDLLAYLTANDSTLPDRIMKYERKILMNGFYADPSVSEGDGTSGLVIRRVTDVLPLPNEGNADSVAHLVPTPEDGAFLCDNMPGIRFVDVGKMAEQLVQGLSKRPDMKAMNEAVDALGEGDFSKLFALAAGTKSGDVTPQESENAIQRMFTASVGRYGGAYMVLPENMAPVNASVDIGLKTKGENGAVVPAFVDLKGYAMLDGEEKSVVPAFLSAREIPDQDTGLSVSPVDDRKQFQIFKSILAGAVVEKIGEMHDGSQRYASTGNCVNASNALLKTLKETYADCPNQKSMSLENMNGWLKKNVYRTVTPNSLTCVWNGNPTLEIDEAGLSFEKAKSLGILKPKASLSREELSQIPDTYEFMSQRYEPLTDNDFILVNRSPGQTTGCIRALRVKITSEDGKGLEINPACATIFDGDFDGDTVGVSYPAHPVALKDDPETYERLWPRAREVMKDRLTMQGNMCHKADYTTLETPNGVSIEFVHPLFIAKNADYAVALYNMKQPGLDGKPVCGYDIGKEMDRTTAMANMLEHLRQCAYDAENVAAGKISPDAGRNIILARMEQITALHGMFGDTGVAKFHAGDDRNARDDRTLNAGWNGILKEFDEASKVLFTGDPLQSAARLDLKAVSKMDRETFSHLSAAYRDMPAYMTDPSLMTHGKSACETLYHIISDANISKKGKEPQLNALLKFAGVHEDCGGHLSVAKNADGKFELLYDGQPSVAGKFEPDKGIFDPEIRMDHHNAKSDVAPSRFFTQSESNLVAQGCKSDGTGLGGAAAQKLQKIMAPLGYGETGLRMSGPITQNFLDAKQNVQRCATNMNIGKTILNSIVGFGCVQEFADADLKSKDPDSLYGGQFTVQSQRPLSRDECTKQMDNFLISIGQPGFSKIDMAIMNAVLSEYETVSKSGPCVKNPVRTADEHYDASYASMYGTDDGYPELLDKLATEKRGIYSNGIYSGQVDTGYLMGRLMERTASEIERNSQCAHTSEFVEQFREAAKQVSRSSLEQQGSSRHTVVVESEAPFVPVAAKPVPTRNTSYHDNLFAMLGSNDSVQDDDPEDKQTKCPVDDM